MLYPRRLWLQVAASFSAFSFQASSQQAAADPWPSSALLEPSDLATLLRTESKRPAVICVAFPVLYRQRHIPGAKFAGPTGKPEGIAALKETVAKMSKDAEIALYCGCCPMVKCPNVRPAYSLLKELGFTNVRVLNIPANFHNDWVEKGFPVEPPV